jgi:hypothetical protein
MWSQPSQVVWTFCRAAIAQGVMDQDAYTYGFLNYTKDGPKSPDLEKKMDEVVDR